MPTTRKRGSAPEFDSSMPPNVGAQPDLPGLTAVAAHEALLDGSSGAWTPEAIDAHEGDLPGAAATGDRVTVEQTVTHIREASAEGVEDAIGCHEAFEGGVTAVTLELADNDPVQKLEQIDRLRAEALARLEGEALPDGSRYPGAAPVPPIVTRALGRRETLMLRLRPAVLTRWFVDVGFTLLVLIAESTVAAVVLAPVLNVDDDVKLLLLSFVIGLGISIAPHAAGIGISKLLHGVRPVAYPVTLTAVGLTAWLCFGAAMAWARTRADLRAYEQRLQDAQSDAGGAALIEVAAFDWWASFVLWGSIALVVGVAVLLVKMTSSNPVLSALVRLDSQRAIAVSERLRISGASERIRIRAEFRARQQERTRQMWRDLREDVLPAWRRLTRRHYLNAFINVVADPDATNAIARHAAAADDDPSASA